MEMLKNTPQLAARVFRQERIHDTGTMREPQLREAKTFPSCVLCGVLCDLCGKAFTAKYAKDAKKTAN
jgi:hypothetical protein